MEVDWDQLEDEEEVDESCDEDEDMVREFPVKAPQRMPMICTLCDCSMPDGRAILAHVLSIGHNRRLKMETARPNKDLLKSLKKREVLRKNSSWRSKETILTKKFKYVSPPGNQRELEDGEIEDSEEDCCEPGPVKPLSKESSSNNAPVPATPVSRIDLRNRLNYMKEKQQEERKAEKRKKKNIRTREAKKRNKKLAKEDKKRIEDALEALEEEDENIAFMKHTMGFSKFQSTKRSYF